MDSDTDSFHVSSDDAMDDFEETSSSSTKSGRHSSLSAHGLQDSLSDYFTPRSSRRTTKTVSYAAIAKGIPQDSANFVRSQPPMPPALKIKQSGRCEIVKTKIRNLRSNKGSVPSVPKISAPPPQVLKVFETHSVGTIKKIANPPLPILPKSNAVRSLPGVVPLATPKKEIEKQNFSRFPRILRNQKAVKTALEAKPQPDKEKQEMMQSSHVSGGSLVNIRTRTPIVPAAVIPELSMPGSLPVSHISTPVINKLLPAIPSAVLHRDPYDLNTNEGIKRFDNFMMKMPPASQFLQWAMMQQQYFGSYVPIGSFTGYPSPWSFTPYSANSNPMTRPPPLLPQPVVNNVPSNANTQNILSPIPEAEARQSLETYEFAQPENLTNLDEEAYWDDFMNMISEEQRSCS